MAGMAELAKLLNMEPEPEEPEQSTEPKFYQNSTYAIVSKVAYLIGVPKGIFDNPHEPPKPEIYEKLELNKFARIIRNLCMVRTAIERNFKSINDSMKNDYKSIMSMPKLIPQECIIQLERDGVYFVKKSSTKLTDHIVEINRLISDRINNCKSIFPLWLNWQYLRGIFIMPDGLREAGTKAAADLYYSNIGCYPYQVYINWIPSQKGNILYSDKKFVTLLYEWNLDFFTDLSKVSDAGDGVKENIYDFIRESRKIVVVVDCENSDPYKLSATLKQLDAEYIGKISSIILFDDVHTTSAWNILSEYTDIPVDYVLIERIKENKSLVDIRLTARTCQEYYENSVDSFIICSSDSDYWGLISSLPKARFLAMIEWEKCGPDMKNALFNSGIFYCYLDNFYSGDAESLKFGALFRAMNRYIDENVRLNVNDMLDAALLDTRVEMTASERKQFVEKYIKTMRMTIHSDGRVTIDLKKAP